MSEFVCDGTPVSHEAFVRRALDPGASAVVEACAGSGKTWLLVGRIVRLLLAGAAPGQILAITFTRRAAQEMRQRLLQDLAQLARADHDGVRDLLLQRGLDLREAQAALPAARGLYERVAEPDDTVSIETFHGWFWRILRCAPLGSGVPHTANLLESTERMRQDAWGDFSAELVEAEASGRGDAADGLLAAYEALLSRYGESNTSKLLDNFLDKRAEWWSFAGGESEESAIDRACGPMRAALDAAGFPSAEHPGRVLRGAAFTDALRALLGCWQAVAEPSAEQRKATHKAQEFLSGGADPQTDPALAADVLLTQKGTPRVQLEPEEVARRNPALDARYPAWLGQAHDVLRRAQAAQEDWDALHLNLAGLRCGVRLLRAFEARKRQANVLDFTDIECFADRLLRSEDTAAYMQAHLDSRYRHLLVDEFQDTSTLQWRVLQCWLNAYEGDAQRPTVFVVGDPKQSIYRFRRAEPRVFEAARLHLAVTMGAAHLRTNVTRRNPAALVAVLDAVFAGRNALYLSLIHISEPTRPY